LKENDLYKRLSADELAGVKPLIDLTLKEAQTNELKFLITIKRETRGELREVIEERIKQLQNILKL
jgi:hypothetical protein